MMVESGRVPGRTPERAGGERGEIRDRRVIHRQAGQNLNGKGIIPNQLTFLVTSTYMT